MIGLSVVDKFIKELIDIENTIPNSELNLLELYHKAGDATVNLEDSIQQIILPLPQQTQIQILNQSLQQLNMESSMFNSCDWWIEECIRGKPKECWLGELEEGRKFMGLSREAMSETAYNIALSMAEQQDPTSKRINEWKAAFGLIKKMGSFRYKDLSLIIKDYEENDDAFPFSNQNFDDNLFNGYYTSVIVTAQLKRAIYSLASHLTFVSDPKAGWTASPSLRWTSTIETNLTDLISGLYDQEKVGNNLAIEWRRSLSDARDKICEVFYWDKNSETSYKTEPPTPEQYPVLKWQGSKTELAELGYALLESGLISGPREATLKILADFFGQDLGNPAKHLQTLQKRKWDPSDKEPVTPLLDKLKVALKSVLKIKAIAPIKK